MPKTTVNSAAKECVEAGYVICSASNDGREKLLSLTASGKEYAETVLKCVFDVEIKAIEKILKEFYIAGADAVACVKSICCNMAKTAILFTSYRIVLQATIKRKSPKC